MKLTVNRCCFFFNTRTGSIIIGAITIFGSLMMSLIFIKDSLYVAAFAPIETIIFSCLLLKGIIQEKPFYMLPWLCTTFSVILLGPTEAGYVIESADFESENIVYDLITLGIIILASSVVIGAFLVVFSHYKNLLIPKNRVLSTGQDDPAYTIFV